MKKRSSKQKRSSQQSPDSRHGPGFSQEPSSQGGVSPLPPRVCLVTPVFNGSAFIDQTLLSLTSQAGAFRLRLHVQDGGSLDDTRKKLQLWTERLLRPDFPRCCESIEFTWASEPDRGMYDAINRGFDAVEVDDEDILGWVNSDDILLPGAVAYACHRMAQFPELSWLTGRPCESDAGGVMRKIHATQIYNQELLRAGLHDGRHLAFVMQEGSFWRGWLWRKVGGLRPDLRLAGDYDLWRRFAEWAALYPCDQTLAVHRRHPLQLSAQGSRYMEEMDNALFSTAESQLREEVWTSYQEWVADPDRTERFDAAVIVYNPGPDSWAVEKRQPPTKQPTLFVRPDGTGYPMIACELREGFTPEEGPYPNLRLPSIFCFAPAGDNRVVVTVADRGSYWIVTRFRNFIDGMRLQCFIGGHEKHSCPVPVTDHKRDGLLFFQVMLRQGENQLDLRVTLPMESIGAGLLVLSIEALPSSALFS